MLIVLLIMIIAFLFISYYLTGKDVFSPPCIICESFIVSIILASYNWNNWGLSSYGLDTVLILLLGIFSFIVGCLISYSVVKPVKSKVNQNRELQYSPNPIQINMTLLLLAAAYEWLICIQYYRNLQRIVGERGFETSLTSVLYHYNQLLTNNMLDSKAIGSFLLRQNVKVCFVLGLIVMAIATNNIVVEGIKKRHGVFLLVLIPSVVLSVVGSTRINIFKYLAFFITVFNVVYHRKNGWNHTISIKFIMKFGIAFAGVLAVFTSLRNLMGRGTRFDPMYYISVYAGGSIKLFDMYIEAGRSSNIIPGQETFYNFMGLLHRYGIIDDPYKRLEFRSYNGYYVGNVYTAFRRYYNDFGLAGMTVIALVLGFVLMFLYIKCKNGKHMLSLLDLRLLLFAMITWGMYLMSIDECILSTVIAILYVTYIIIMIVLWYVYRNIKLIRKGIIVMRKRKSMI